MTKDTRQRFTFRLPEELFVKIRDTAKKQGVSINALILQILWNYINKKGA